ncbi:hypothetical protein OPV22_008471 [Ensete ventricosum]|uniref:Single-stranded DNA binding protein Ssb-like OB fold domain-containing protein n=1 Tax=Ensete ventricosum TaxID=4639 RepID=A0AAV8PPT1_ENSVE|nr:hypothetical protein OPV22_008471 [Ensete ventricosum]
MVKSLPSVIGGGIRPKPGAFRPLETLILGFAPCVLVSSISRPDMAESKPTMRKPEFTKVDQLRPGTGGHTLTVKVVSSKMVLQKGRTAGPQVRQMRLAECLVGDETGMIVFTARNDQVDVMKPDTTVILRNAKIDMFKGSMRLAVDKWGRIEVTDPADFTLKNSYAKVERRSLRYNRHENTRRYNTANSASIFLLK